MVTSAVAALASKEPVEVNTSGSGEVCGKWRGGGMIPYLSPHKSTHSSKQPVEKIIRQCSISNPSLTSKKVNMSVLLRETRASLHTSKYHRERRGEVPKDPRRGPGREQEC